MRFAGGVHIVLVGVFVTALAFEAQPAQAGHEPFEVYEDWSSGRTMRSERWGGSVDSAQEINREVLKRKGKLSMRLRREGATTSDAGFTGAFHRLAFANPLAVDQVEATVEVKHLDVTPCAANVTFPSRIRTVQISLNKFNDGSSMGPGDLTGDHFGRIQVNRDGDSTDPRRWMRVQAFVFRCVDRPCSNAFSVGPGVFFADPVAVDQPFTLRLIWDALNDRFLAGVGSGPDVALPYPATANVKAPGLPFSDIRINGLAANCTAGPTVTDATIEVGEVLTNASAIVP